MKVGLFADLHLHPHARFSSITESGFNSWVQNGLDVLDRIYTECHQRGIWDVWCLGDLFHVGTRLHTKMFNEVYRFFAQKKAQGFRTILIAGNHDQVARQSTDSALYCLKEAVREVFLSPVIQHWTLEEAYHIPILFLPYTEEYGLVKKYVDNLAVSEITPKLVVGHLAVAGAVVGRCEYQPKEGCSGGLFAGVDRVFLGHYHKRQIVTPEVSYIGSATSVDFGDAGEIKGFTILEVKDGEVSTEFVPIRSIGFAVFGEGDAVGSYDLGDRIVRVDYAGALDEDVTRQLLLEAGARVVTFNRKTVREVEQRAVDPQQDLPGCIRTYVERNGEGYDSARLVNLGLELAGVVEDKSSG